MVSYPFSIVVKLLIMSEQLGTYCAVDKQCFAANPAWLSGSFAAQGPIYNVLLSESVFVFADLLMTQSASLICEGHVQPKVHVCLMACRVRVGVRER